MYTGKYQHQISIVTVFLLALTLHLAPCKIQNDHKECRIMSTINTKQLIHNECLREKNKPNFALLPLKISTHLDFHLVAVQLYVQPFI